MAIFNIKSLDWQSLLAQWSNGKDQTQREKWFGDWLETEMRRYFDMKREADGETLRDKSGVRIDFLCRPKPNLQRLGFPNVFFGIEAKYPLGWGERGCSSITKWIAQMTIYRHSRYLSNEGDYTITPSFILSAPPLSDVLDSLNKHLTPRWTNGITHQLGLGELNFRTRARYDPPNDFRGDSYEIVLEIRFNGGIFWSNTHQKMGSWPGKHIFTKKTLNHWKAEPAGVIRRSPT